MTNRTRVKIIDTARYGVLDTITRVATAIAWCLSMFNLVLVSSPWGIAWGSLALALITASRHDRLVQDLVRLGVVREQD